MAREIINECCFLSLTYLNITFSAILNDFYVKYQFGWAYILVLCAMLVLNIIPAYYGAVRGMIRKVKMRIAMRGKTVAPAANKRKVSGSNLPSFTQLQ